jgi:hypothetical protein
MRETARQSMSEPKPSEKFRKAMKQILSVPKEELQRRETEYQKGRTAKKSKGASKGGAK